MESVFYFLIKNLKTKKYSHKVNYIFLGLTIFGINKTPKTKSNNGAIITKSDSIFIKVLKNIFLNLGKNQY